MSDDILDMAIIGAGISGIGMAARLVHDLPDKRFVVLERRARLGGTWDLFRYPGVRSDSDMYTLGYSFAPWPSDRAIGQGAAIRDYLEQVARDHGVWPHIRIDARVLSADWDSATRCWTLALARGPAVRARFVFCGAGYYDADAPYAAGIPGLDRFAGRVVHPQFWPDDLDHAGQRVAVIGSGATAVTLVPAMAKTAAHVTMVQRTPSWYLVMPSRDRFAALLRRWLPARAAHRLIRARNVRLQDLFYRRCRADPAGMGEWLAGNVRKALGPAWDPRHFTPPYPPWEQRLCLTPDADLFRAIRKGRASMATGVIAGVEPEGIRMADGSLVAADVIVTATGLTVAPMGNLPVSIDGATVAFAERWWYRDCMFSDVPNFAALFGYLNAGWTLRVELVADYLCRLLRQMDAWHARVVTPVLPAGAEPAEGDLFADYSSGYIQRARGSVARSARDGPWRIGMDYLADRAELAAAPLDDPWLRFDRTTVPATKAEPALVDSGPTT